MESNNTATPTSFVSQSGAHEPGINSFITDFNSPAKAAVDTPLEPEKVQPVSTAGSSDVSFFPPPPPPPPEPAAPIFGDKPENKPDEPPPPLPVKESEAKLRFFITLIDHFQAKGFAKLAKEMEDEQFRLDDEDIDMLVRAYLPYMEQHGGKIPTWFEAAFVTAWVFGAKTVKALELRKLNNRNAAVAANPNTARVIALTPDKKERTKFKVDSRGMYVYDLFGNYIKSEDRTEKADLSNLTPLLESNGEKALVKAFPELEEQIKNGA